MADTQDTVMESSGKSGDKQRRDTLLQMHGQKIVSTLYMLIRNVKIHAPENAIFLKPIESLREMMNVIISMDRQLNLQACDTSVLLNNSLLKFSFNALSNVAYLTKEFEARDIGGFSTTRPVTTQEIRDFLHLFSGNFSGSVEAEDGAEGHELPSIRLAKFAHVKEVLDKLQEEVDLDKQIDRKKYAMTVYARAVFLIERTFEKVLEGETNLPFSKAARIVQDMVDLVYEQRSHFLGLTTTKSSGNYLAFHSVNLCLMSIVFGSELGFDRRQLHELGLAALFSQLGLLDVPEEILSHPGGLTPEERALIDLYPLRSAKRILQARGLDKSTMSRIVSTYESKVDYAIPQREADGEVSLIMPKVNLGMYGKIISIVDCYDALTSSRPFREPYGPEIALALMFSDMKFKFDPVLLRVFMKVMAIQPIKILSEEESRVRIG